jgi:hemoglobin/transferrin/lactoferrin receptor protein
MPETTVAAPAQQADALDPAQTPYATELLNRAEMERQQVLDIRDATRDMVNVEVPRQPARGPAFRAPQGEKAIPASRFAAWAATACRCWWTVFPSPRQTALNSHSFGRDYVDPLTLSSIEVHKGVSPVSMPAGGIAGAVNLRTLSPSDLLRTARRWLAERCWAGAAKARG